MATTTSAYPARLSCVPGFVLLGVAVLIGLVALAGCRGSGSSLAARDSFYTSAASAGGGVAAEARAAIAAHRELLIVQRACGRTIPDPHLEKDLGVACRAQATGYYGRPAGAYGRWVTDTVRELPAPSATASSAGG